METGWDACADGSGGNTSNTKLINRLASQGASAGSGCWPFRLRQALDTTLRESILGAELSPTFASFACIYG